MAKWRRRRIAFGVTVLLVVTAGCGDVEDQSLCTVYAQHLDERAAVQELDAESLTATEAAAVAEGYLESVRRLQEVADGRFSAPLASLEEAAADVLRTLESVPADADYATWAPLVEDSLDAAADAAVTVQDAFEPQCPDAGDEG